MRDCLHQTMHVEKKDKEQGIAQCMNMWRQRHKKMAHNIIVAFTTGALSFKEYANYQYGHPALPLIAHKTMYELYLKEMEKGDERAKQLTDMVREKVSKKADYPDHPQDIVVSKNENIAGLKPIKEIDVWNYYDGVKNEMLKEIKDRNLFVAIKLKGELKKGQKPVYVRHPYDKKTEYIRINNIGDFEKYHSGRNVEIHVTMPQMAPYYVIDFDAGDEPFSQTKKITAEIADELEKLSEVKRIEVRYTGKRGFHILAWLKKARDVDGAREFLKDWLKNNFGDRDDVVIGESPKGKKGALGLSPMKLNGGQIAKYSLRVSGLCCIEVPRSKLMSFEREDASLEKTYKKITGKIFKYDNEGSKEAHSIQTIINNFINEDAHIVSSGHAGIGASTPSYKLDIIAHRYKRDLLKSGYKGTFVIHDHKAERAGDHFDVRLSFPVESLKEALKNYGSKRPKTNEPKKEYPDKPGEVYRSFVDKKCILPTGNKKVFLVETEDHPLEYGKFKGTIEEGYGAGKVDIWDHGTYELLDVEGNKKYVYDFKGKKLNGKYALIKYQKGYLWVKVKNRKEASAIDYVQPTMCENIWDLSKDPPILIEEVKASLLSILVSSLTDNGLSRPLNWIENIFISGSSTSYNYQEDGDIDIDIEYTPSEVKNLYPDLAKLSDQELHDHIQKILDTNRNKTVPNSNITYSFFLIIHGDYPGSDGIYDVLKDKWLKVPIKIPESFDPDKAFKKEKTAAIIIVNEIFRVISQVRILLKDLERVDSFIKNHDKLNTKRIVILSEVKGLCLLLARWRKNIWKLHEDSKDPNKAKFPAFNYSSNWDEKYILFKYISRYGCHEPVQMLYWILKDDPYLDMIKKIMPDNSVGRFFK